VNPSRKSIVLVDDEKTYVDLLAQLLTENLGCSVVVFHGPIEALAALPTIDVGCVVSDFHMPDMNGYEFIRRAAIIVPGVPFIMISGHAVHLMENRSAWPAAMTSLLAKPFSWRKLGEEIAIRAPELGTRLAKPQTNPRTI
jgi:two-component system response regulator FixJ